MAKFTIAFVLFSLVAVALANVGYLSDTYSSGRYSDDGSYKGGYKYVGSSNRQYSGPGSYSGGYMKGGYSNGGAGKSMGGSYYGEYSGDKGYGTYSNANGPYSTVYGIKNNGY